MYAYHPKTPQGLFYVYYLSCLILKNLRDQNIGDFLLPIYKYHHVQYYKTKLSVSEYLHIYDYYSIHIACDKK